MIKKIISLSRLSLRGVRRRSNPVDSIGCARLPRFARNDFFKGFLLLLPLLLIMTFACKDKGPVLHLMTSLDPIEAQEYIQAFEKDTGIKVKWVRLSAGEALARFAAERSRPTQSVWFGGSITEYIQAKHEGFLEPYASPEADGIDKQWRDKEDCWTGIYIGTIAFVTNEEFLKKNNLTPPTSWNDLLKPEFKEKIATSLPYTAGTGYTILAGLISSMDEEGAFSYYEKLNGQIHHYTKSGTAPIVETGLGEVAVGVAFSQDIVRKGIQRGLPVVITYPEAVPYEVGGVALIKNGPEQEFGKRFIDWVTSLKGQNLFEKWARIPIRNDANKPTSVKGLSDIRIVKMNMDKMGSSRNLYIKRWRREFGK